MRYGQPTEWKASKGIGEALQETMSEPLALKSVKETREYYLGTIGEG